MLFVKGLLLSVFGYNSHFNNHQNLVAVVYLLIGVLQVAANYESIKWNDFAAIWNSKMSDTFQKDPHDT